MSIQNMTQKSAEAIRTAQATAMEYANQEVREEHLLVALLSAEEGLIPSLLRKMGVSAETVLREAGEAIDKLPKVSGMTADRVYYSRGFDAVLRSADAEAKKMKDAFISVEHLMLGLLSSAGTAVKQIFKRNGITEPDFLAALRTVRGARGVQTDNPEETYDALVKYGQNLTDLAKSQKLEPVIGRDDEIRNVIRILSRKSKKSIFQMLLSRGTV